MFYSINAVDTFFFRNPTPFDAGVNFHSVSLFPPLPSVYAGALRHGKKLNAREIKIGFNGLMANNRFLFPRPLDTVVLEDKRHVPRLELLRLKRSPTGSSPLTYALAAKSNSVQKEMKLRGGGYMDENELQAYLSGKKTNFSCQELASYIHAENHIGIAIDRKTGRTEDRKWYSIQRIRPKDQKDRHCSLVVEAKGINLNDDMVLKVGGESKVASVKRLDRMFVISPVVSAEKIFKLYIATPAIFKHGWLPWWIDPETKEGWFAYKKRKIRVRLISAVVGRPVSAGGFGRVQGDPTPRELRLAIPAGSVYFFEILEGTMTDAVKLFHQKCLSDYRENLGFEYRNWDRLRYCDRGFGYSLVGKVNDEQGGSLSCTK